MGESVGACGIGPRIADAGWPASATKLKERSVVRLRGRWKIERASWCRETKLWSSIAPRLLSDVASSQPPDQSNGHGIAHAAAADCNAPIASGRSMCVAWIGCECVRL